MHSLERKKVDHLSNTLLCYMANWKRLCILEQNKTNSNAIVTDAQACYL